jgi:stage V sporulation protein R
VRYISQLIQHRMGHSRLFEVVFPGNPGRAYLASGNSLAENVLVTAHVLGHADFSRNNLLFERSQQQVGTRIVERAAAHAHQIARAIEEHGAERVERILDAALALEQYVDVDLPLGRTRFPEYLQPRDPPEAGDFQKRFAALDAVEGAPGTDRAMKRAPLPPRPERDLLWFIAQYAPELEGWERDIFLAVREESFYFYPVFATQIMNEGWASYWHARLLREADFLPQDAYVDAIKCHSDVVRPLASGETVALAINPYHVGFSLWEHIIDESGVDAARRVMREDDDFSFIRNHLTPELAEEMHLFRYRRDERGAVKVVEPDMEALHDAILAPKYNFGAPAVAVMAVKVDGTLELVHDHGIDGRGLDAERAARVLEYLQRVWRRPVRLRTVDGGGKELELGVEAT